VVRLSRSNKKTPAWTARVGELFRVGYYSKQDGLDVVWLVSESGKYEQATDHEFLNKYFVVHAVSLEKDFFGVDRKTLGPLIKKLK